MRIKFNLYKDGKKRAFTMSYDDGQIHDLRLIEIFNKYGIKGTFNLNSNNIGKPGYVTAEDICSKYVGHEVASHGLTHHYFERIPREELICEVMEDRRRLESICGYPVNGLAYPYGTLSEDVKNELRALGICYARGTVKTRDYELGNVPPHDFLAWNPTVEHRDPKMFELLDGFLRKEKVRPLSLFYIYGHSYSFNDDNNWDLMERICERAGNDPDTWYATNIEIYDYLTALWQLRFTAARDAVYNPTCLDLWIEVDRKPVMIPAGKLTRLGGN